MKYDDLNKEEYFELMKNPPDNVRFRVYYINKSGEPKTMKTAKKKYTLTQIGDALFEFINTTNERFDRIENRIDRIDARLDYNNLKELPSNK